MWGAGTACFFNCSSVAKNTPKLVEQGFDSYRAFVKAMGKADPSGQNLRQWHHIVEQNPANKLQFGEKSLQNGENIVNITAEMHRKISGYYSSNVPGLSIKVRDVISNLSFSEQTGIGQHVLNNVINGKTPGSGIGF